MRLRRRAFAAVLPLGAAALLAANVILSFGGGKGKLEARHIKRTDESSPQFMDADLSAAEDGVSDVDSDAVDWTQEDDRAAPNLTDDEDEKLPFQADPWVDGNAKDSDPLAAFDFEAGEVDRCYFRAFGNASAYGRPSFAAEYSAYKRCAGLSEDDLWLRAKIKARRGAKDELILRSNLLFEGGKGFCQDPPDVLYVISSKRPRLSWRTAARRSWASEELLPKGHEVVFVVGRSEKDVTNEKDVIATEVDENGDEATYAIRQTAATLALVHTRCELSRLVAFVTDDTWVNVRRFSMLADLEFGSANRLYGELLKLMEPDRSPSGKHHITEKNWPWQNFPPFLKGPAYVATGDAVTRMLAAVPHTPVVRLSQVTRATLRTIVLLGLCTGASDGEEKRGKRPIASRERQAPLQTRSSGH